MLIILKTGRYPGKRCLSLEGNFKKIVQACFRQAFLYT
ncbi:hypothetical protein CHY_2117 [Carboxydothermus hydrogenoformans Z-2901]|uniref:Uncharacterized protein n=1 Tax=Carboxydothermus hydrogenoformans (strain ATCC BAA-161 / DSM 6008 / Z-2901) TaxID=246194 RepID=Q3AAA3_CARHZ|nr:hypothetical protein CHY_2117 [Carboxydothermus hydrogenoformans Z-2901]